MDQPIHFLNFKTLLRYLGIFAVVLFGGYFAKDAFAILVICAILFYVIKRHCFKAVELWLIWFFSYGFYTSQGFFANEVISKYVAKPPFILFVIFLGFFQKIPLNIKTAKFTGAWLIFLAISLFSIVYHGQSPFVLITVSSFFFIYMLLSGRNFSIDQCRKLLNFFIAVALLQTFVSVLQVTQMVAPPTKMMDDGSGGQFQWIAGLDDVASGTFGAASSSVVSWYASLTALFCILVWAVCRKRNYLIIAVLALGQFATVDSKTIMGVMFIMMLYLLYYFNKHRTLFTLKIKKIISIVVIASIVGYGLISIWSFYYEYQSSTKSGASQRGNLSTVYEDEIKKSEDLIAANIGDWGKVQGFRYVMEDFTKEGTVESIFGYGLLGYTYNGKMQYIEGKDTRLMQLNNFTRSRSALITQFAQSGILGFMLFFVMLVLWGKYNLKKQGSHDIDIVTMGMIKIFLPFTLIAAFIYSISITGVTIIAFAALIAILRKYSRLIWFEEEIALDEEDVIYNQEESVL